MLRSLSRVPVQRFAGHKSLVALRPPAKAFITNMERMGRGGLSYYQGGSRQYSCSAPRLADTVTFTYVEADGSEKEVQAEIGKNLMEVAHEHNVELEGACGGELACSTCHLIFEKEIYDTLPEKDDEEDDMLDLAFEVTETSRLGCQVLVQEHFDGMKVKIPDDGF